MSRRLKGTTEQLAEIQSTTTTTKVEKGKDAADKQQLERCGNECSEIKVISDELSTNLNKAVKVYQHLQNIHELHKGLGENSDVDKDKESRLAKDDEMLAEQVRRVQLFMEKSGMKQHTLARRVGCSQGTLSSWLKLKYAGDVHRITSRVQAALDVLEKLPLDVIRMTDVNTTTPVQASTVRRKNFSREQVEILEQIARHTPNPTSDVVEMLSGGFGREQRHIIKWFSNWRNRKLPKQLHASSGRQSQVSGATALRQLSDDQLKQEVSMLLAMMRAKKMEAMSDGTNPAPQQQAQQPMLGNAQGLGNMGGLDNSQRQPATHQRPMSAPQTQLAQAQLSQHTMQSSLVNVNSHGQPAIHQQPMSAPQTQLSQAELSQHMMQSPLVNAPGMGNMGSLNNTSQSQLPMPLPQAQLSEAQLSQHMMQAALAGQQPQQRMFGNLNNSSQLHPIDHQQQQQNGQQQQQIQEHMQMQLAHHQMMLHKQMTGLQKELGIPHMHMQASHMQDAARPAMRFHPVEVVDDKSGEIRVHYVPLNA